jgi:glycosyltransferase involved in cell wall biosynthesis
MTGRESALILSAVSPVPVDNGKRMILSGMLDYFLERLGVENVHYALIGTPGEARPSFQGTAYRLDPPGTVAKLITLGKMPFDRSYSAQEAMLGSRSLREQIRALTAWLRPTVEVYDTLRIGQHAPATPRPRCRVLYLDDLFSLRYDKMLSLKRADLAAIDPLGEFAPHIPAPLRPVIRKPVVYRHLLQMERNRMHRRESEILGGFDANLLINNCEAVALRARSGSSTLQTITGLMPAIERPVRRPANPPEFIFLGRLNIPHNDDGIREFLRLAMPSLVRRMPGALIRIIGKSPSRELVAMVDQYKNNVRLEGFVEDLEPLFAGATASLVPLRLGSGVKIKILETLARGLPVLSTYHGINGIPASLDGSDGCLLDDDLSKWPDVLCAMADPVQNAQLSKGARTLFDRVYDRGAVMAQYDSIFGLGGHGAVEPREDAIA